jgi:hypothetical protein
MKRETERLKLEQMNFVILPDEGEKYEIVAGEVVRVRCLTTLRYLDSGRNNDLVLRHAIPVLSSENFDRRKVQVIEVAGRQMRIWPPIKKWVIRRLDGRVYQMHPESCWPFARKQLRKLEKREAQLGTGT